MWSDDRAVFLLTTDGKSRPAIWSNRGAGWQMTFNWPGDTNTMLQGGGLQGFPNGSLIVYGGIPCGIQFIDGGAAECSGAESFIAGLSVPGSGRAYAGSYDRVLAFDGELWTQLGDPLPGVSWTLAVSADSSTVVVTALGSGGDGGLVLTIGESGKPVSLPALPSQILPYAVWGFGASDIWVGGEKGQLAHYDGTGWSVKATIPYDGSGSLTVSGVSGIGKIKLWGQAGKLFAIAGNVFGQWDGALFKVLDTLESSAYFEGLWGNSPSEVFLAIHSRQSPSLSDTCGPFRARWFDGKSVSPL